MSPKPRCEFWKVAGVAVQRTRLGFIANIVRRRTDRYCYTEQARVRTWGVSFRCPFCTKYTSLYDTWLGRPIPLYHDLPFGIAQINHMRLMLFIDAMSM